MMNELEASEAIKRKIQSRHYLLTCRETINPRRTKTPETQATAACSDVYLRRVANKILGNINNLVASTCGVLFAAALTFFSFWCGSSTCEVAPVLKLTGNTLWMFSPVKLCGPGELEVRFTDDPRFQTWFIWSDSLALRLRVA